MEVVGYEVHDAGLALEALEYSFWLDDMLVACRTGASFCDPDGSQAITGQEHIIIPNSLFLRLVLSLYLKT